MYVGSPLFTSQADVVLEAKAAAIAHRATPVDRPEAIKVHPLTGHVYIALTNNTLHGNYHGQLVRIRETDNNPESETFQWDFFATGGPQSGFSSPDNLVFDPYGNLWMVTDISSSRVGRSIYSFQGNNAIIFSTEGPDAGRAYQFASGLNQCEFTSPYWTPDGTTLFLSVQHPGGESESLTELTSNWPNLNGDPMPRPGSWRSAGFRAGDSRKWGIGNGEERGVSFLAPSPLPYAHSLIPIPHEWSMFHVDNRSHRRVSAVDRTDATVDQGARGRSADAIRRVDV